MLLQLISVYDRKVEDFSMPISFKHNADAIRWFQEVVNNPQHEVGKYPSDFSLVHLGEFDTNKALFVPLSMPITLAHGDSLVKAKV